MARACIDEALMHAEAQVPLEGGMFLEQRWDAECRRGCGVSQVLAEREWRRVGEGRSAEELVPQEFHEFLDVFDKQHLERLPQHQPH